MKKLEAKDLYKLRSVAAPKLVPGSDVLYYYITHLREDENDYVTNIYRYENGKHSQVTFKKERLSGLQHAPNGEFSVFVAAADNKQQLYKISLSGGEREQITFEDENVTGFLISKDSKKVYFNASLEVKKLHADEDEKDQEIKDQEKDHKKDKDTKKFPQPEIIERMKYKFDGAGLVKEKYSEIKVLDLETMKVSDVRSKDLVNYNVVASGDDFLVYTSDESDSPDFNFNAEMYIIQDDKETKIETNNGHVFNVEVSPDNKHILYIEMSREFENATHPKIYVYDVEAETSKAIAHDLDRPIGGLVASDFHQSAEMKNAIWINDESFLFVVSDYGSVNLYRGNVNGKYEEVLGGRHHIYGLTANENVAYLAISKHDDPGEIYRLDLKTKDLEKITEVNQEYLENTTLVDPLDISYKSKDGTEIHGWLMKPSQFESGKKYPLVTNVHGGPHALYANTFFHEMQLFASLGYAVLFVNPRGSHSYSQAFVDAVRGDYGGGDYEDIMAGVDHVIQNYDWIDTENLGITGGSYGGFMTNWVVGHTDRFKAAVTQRSISNWTSFRGVSDIGYYFTDWQIQAPFDDIEK